MLEDFIKYLEKNSTLALLKKAHFIITLYIREQSGYAHFESICKDIPKNVANRGTIQSILDMGIKLNIYTKLTYPNDKRVKLYNLSKDASIEVNRFFNDFLKLSEYKRNKNYNKKTVKLLNAIDGWVWDNTERAKKAKWSPTHIEKKK